MRPRFWPLALACAGCAAGIALGNWQSGRAEEKRAAAAQLERVALHGEFVPQHTVFLGNRLRHGRPGYEIVTPLRLRGGASHVLVNRGWLAAGTALPQVRTPEGPVTVEGVAVKRLARVLDPGGGAKGPVRQNLDIGEFAAETRLALEPRVIEQHSSAPDGLLREWPRPDAGADKNEAYALQWYSLAALAGALGLAFGFRRVAPG
ncbi:MAG: SURF1 family protein [Betaproteobacteria bacterium]